MFFVSERFFALAGVDQIGLEIAPESASRLAKHSVARRVTRDTKPHRSAACFSQCTKVETVSSSDVEFVST